MVLGRDSHAAMAIEVGVDLFKRLGMALLAIGSCGWPAMRAYAALDATGQREVAALLTFVGNSHCTFIRNGSSYSGVAARAHLQSKLEYLEHRDQINSAEEFIARAASTSSFSGKPYKVNCDGKEQLSADWLTEELLRLRQAEP
ncbi:DUF5329 domain-containing protein [Dyella humicola]|uniref:DUF5329 domain-containing protein n=1 Tax=Dyella humicola TaxID=2992126 RepID=UPI00225BAC04|nr:DUF5329 domain-containing protein [Dyella humicola]